MKFDIYQAAETAKELGIDFDKAGFSLDDFLRGMNVELEHGKANPATNTTDDDPIITGKIALAHLNESPKYYDEKIGLEAWEASLEKGTKTQTHKTEYKTLSFEVEDFDEEEGVFSGYAAVFGNVDTGGDIIEPGSFTKSIAKGLARKKILALHNDQWLPIGKPIVIREDSHGLYIKAQISDTTMGRDVKTLLKDGVINELSIGYDPVVFDYDSDGIRHLRELELWEVSVVTWAMNPEALITNYKSLDVTSDLAEIKAGRKISAKRIKSLSDACKTLDAVSKSIKAVINECEGQKTAKPRKAKSKPMIEITF